MNKNWFKPQLPLTFTKYKMSVIIGMYRMGNVETVIASVVNCEIWEVQQTIKSYQLSK